MVGVAHMEVPGTRVAGEGGRGWVIGWLGGEGGEPCTGSSWDLFGPFWLLGRMGVCWGGLWGLQSVFSDAPCVVAPSDTAGASWQHQLGFRAPQAVPLKGGADSHLLRVPQGPVHWHGQDLVPA